MKPIVYALIGVALYALQNTIIEVKLKQYSTVGLLVGWYLILLPLGLFLFLYQRHLGQGASMPAGGDFKILAAVAVMFFIADFFYIGAYTSGGDVVAISMIAVLMPVIAALVKFVWVKEVPTTYHFAGFVCAVLAITFIAISNSKKSVMIAPNQAMLSQQK